LDFSIGIDADDNGMADCGTAQGQQPYCILEPGSEFRVHVSLDGLSPTTRDYEGFDAAVEFLGVVSKQKSDSVWPDCGIPATYFDTDFVALGCGLPINGSPSSYVGLIGTSLFTCQTSGSVTLLQGPGNTAVFSVRGGAQYEASPDEILPVACGEPMSGDVDCSVAVESIDAQMTLQKNASLVDKLACEHLSDVNLDSSSDALDSLITLQYVAGLIDGLPVIPEQ
jgi:hypothetical protein